MVYKLGCFWRWLLYTFLVSAAHDTCMTHWTPSGIAPDTVYDTDSETLKATDTDFDTCDASSTFGGYKVSVLNHT